MYSREASTPLRPSILITLLSGFARVSIRIPISQLYLLITISQLAYKHTKGVIKYDKEIINNLDGNIELSDISFAYGENSKPVFNDLNLKINNGEYVAIVGRTGCGKTTLVRLLLCLEKPTQGRILFDDKELETINKNSLRQHIGTVMQDGKLFAGTIYDNIVISNPSLKPEEVWKATEIACIADDIKAMPMGMHTIIQDGGLSLSGGQRQRLLIARAIASKPSIHIFDEATSSLDNITQQKITEALEALQCTRIVVAHRFSTIQRCNRILIIENGKIAEEGTYSDFIEKNWLFKGLLMGSRRNFDKKTPFIDLN